MERLSERELLLEQISEIEELLSATESALDEVYEIRNNLLRFLFNLTKRPSTPSELKSEILKKIEQSIDPFFEKISDFDEKTKLEELNMEPQQSKPSADKMTYEEFSKFQENRRESDRALNLQAMMAGGVTELKLLSKNQSKLIVNHD